MATALKGSQRIVVPGAGPQSTVLTIAQLRDAVGYMKARPEPGRKVTASGVVRIAGTTIEIKASGILDGNVIRNVDIADSVIGAKVKTDGLPEGVTVVGVKPAVAPARFGDILLSNVAPFAPSSGKPQPVTFLAPIDRSMISGLKDTAGLVGARVSGSGIPEEASVSGSGQAGEVALSTPPVAPKPIKVAPAPMLDERAAGELPVSSPAPRFDPVSGKPLAEPAPLAPPTLPMAEIAPPPSAASLDPIDLEFDIPTAPILMEDGVSRLQIAPTEALEALDVTLPPNPVDGQQAFIFSTLPIAELTVLAASGQRLNRSTAPQSKDDSDADKPRVALAENSGIGYLYSESDATWDRIQ